MAHRAGDDLGTRREALDLDADLVTELRHGADVVFTWPVDTEDALADARRLGVDAVIGKDLSILGA